MDMGKGRYSSKRAKYCDGNANVCCCRKQSIKASEDTISPPSYPNKKLLSVG